MKFWQFYYRFSWLVVIWGLIFLGLLPVYGELCYSQSCGDFYLFRLHKLFVGDNSARNIIAIINLILFVLASFGFLKKYKRSYLISGFAVFLCNLQLFFW